LRIERQEDRAQRSGGQERDHEFWTIVQHRRDRVALPYTERTQPSGAALDAVGQFVVADPLFAIDDGYF
jgi:hypothetical protein